MTTGRAPTPVFGADWAVFAQGGVSIVAASRDAANTPILARSVGCRTTPRGDAVTLLLPVPQADRLLAALVPVITIVMAFVVALIMMAILVPIFSLSSAMG